MGKNWQESAGIGNVPYGGGTVPFYAFSARKTGTTRNSRRYLNETDKKRRCESLLFLFLFAGNGMK